MNLKNSKIFICGHKGMVGSSLHGYLRKKKIRKILTSDRKKLDLTKYNQLNKFVKRNKPDFIINCAGKVGGILANSIDPLNFLTQNLEIQLNILKTCMENEIKYFINLGSSCIYPKYSKQPIREEYLLDGRLEITNEGYALAKIVGLKACEYYNKKSNSNYFTLMPCNLYGPNDSFDTNNSHFMPALISKFYKSKFNSKKVEVWGSGKARRELMFVDDFADAVFFFMKKNIKQPYLNIGIGRDFSIDWYAKFLMRKFKVKLKIKYDKTKPDGMPRKCLDITAAKKYGWIPHHNFDKAFDLTLKYFKNNKLK